MVAQCLFGKTHRFIDLQIVRVDTASKIYFTLQLPPTDPWL